MNFRFINLKACLLITGGITMISCSASDKEDRNESIVNVEKGVAPEIATPGTDTLNLTDEKVDKASKEVYETEAGPEGE